MATSKSYSEAASDIRRKVAGLLEDGAVKAELEDTNSARNANRERMAMVVFVGLTSNKEERGRQGTSSKYLLVEIWTKCS